MYFERTMRNFRVRSINSPRQPSPSFLSFSLNELEVVQYCSNFNNFADRCCMVLIERSIGEILRSQ